MDRKKPDTKKAMPGEVLPKEMKKTYMNSVQLALSMTGRISESSQKY
ncbi:hypothetical protein [Actinobacillus equuli]|nr:hypothetical protein [Actinobacillus equuli]WGE49339.1 hypothetical protein NYR67_03260 [Actinobacillus equuli subsp. equuli]SNV29526.1 Uncharacterised protein [Actinobacillus suis]